MKASLALLMTVLLANAAIADDAITVHIRPASVQTDSGLEAPTPPAVLDTAADQAQPMMEGEYIEGDVGFSDGSMGYGQGNGCGCGHHCGLFCKIPCPWRSRCNMPQHQPYFAEPKTYYYFRPYNYIHITQLQSEATFQGATTQNPYDTNIFRQVYADYSASRAEEVPQQPVPPQAQRIDDAVTDGPVIRRLSTFFD